MFPSEASSCRRRRQSHRRSLAEVRQAPRIAARRQRKRRRSGRMCSPALPRQRRRQPTPRPQRGAPPVYVGRRQSRSRRRQASRLRPRHPLSTCRRRSRLRRGAFAGRLQAPIAPPGRPPSRAAPRQGPSRRGAAAAAGADASRRRSSSQAFSRSKAQRRRRLALGQPPLTAERPHPRGCRMRCRPLWQAQAVAAAAAGGRPCRRSCRRPRRLRHERGERMRRQQHPRQSGAGSPRSRGHLSRTLGRRRWHRRLLHVPPADGACRRQRRQRNGPHSGGGSSRLGGKALAPGRQLQRCGDLRVLRCPRTWRTAPVGAAACIAARRAPAPCKAPLSLGIL